MNSFSSCLNLSNKGNIIPTPTKLLCKWADLFRQKSHCLKISLFLIGNMQQKIFCFFTPQIFLFLVISQGDIQRHTCLCSRDSAELAGPMENSAHLLRFTDEYPSRGEVTCQRTHSSGYRALTSDGPLTPPCISLKKKHTPSLK